MVCSSVDARAWATDVVGSRGDVVVRGISLFSSSAATVHIVKACITDRCWHKVVDTALLPRLSLLGTTVRILRRVRSGLDDVIS